MANDLAGAAERLAPRCARARMIVRAAGASAAMVSGSGPTVFGWFSDRPAARRAVAAAAGAGFAGAVADAPATRPRAH
jgi:4-diphosphocytidyl-2-C-methyl-D-erythritol kinase